MGLENSLLKKIVPWAWCWSLQEVWPWGIAFSLQASGTPRCWHYPPLVLCHLWSENRDFQAAVHPGWMRPKAPDHQLKSSSGSGFSRTNVNILGIRTNSFYIQEFEISFLMPWAVQSITLVIIINISLLFILFLIKFPNLQNGNCPPGPRHFSAVSSGSSQRDPSRNFALQVLLSTKSASYSDTSHLNTSLRRGKNIFPWQDHNIILEQFVSCSRTWEKDRCVGTDTDVILEMIFNTILWPLSWAPTMC